MAANLTAQVRGIAKVVTAVANGDLKRKLTVEAKGEIAELAETINEMIDTLATFADQVTTVAREVGVEGQLGGQAKVPGAAGTWKALTENVNQLAANLTTQVRAIAEVATAVTKGDLTRSITVEAQGEVAALKDTINEMIRNLRDTTQKNTEQDWLKTNLAKFSRMLQGQRDLTNVGRMVLSELCPVVAAQQAEFYVLDGDRRDAATHAAGQLRLGSDKTIAASDSTSGKGLVGQCALEKQKILLTNVPPDYIRISSGLGDAAAAEHPRAAAHLRRPGPGRARTGLVRGLQPDAPGVPRSAHRIDRHRAQHDRSQHADGGPAQAVAVARPAAADAGRRNCRTRTRNCRRRPACSPSRTRKWNARTRKSNRPARSSKRRPSSSPSPRSTSPSSWRTCRTNCGRRSTACSFSPISSRKNTEGNLTPQADRVRQDDSLVRQRPADAHQRHSRPLEDRIGHGRGRCRRTAARRSAAATSSGRSATWPKSKNVDFHVEFDAQLPESMLTDAKRLQQIIKNLLSNAFKFTHHGQVTLDRAAGRSTAGAPTTRSSTARRRCWPSRSPTPASASRPTSSRSSSRRSSRPTAPRAASTAARAWAWRSAANCRDCSAAKFGSSRIPGAGSTFTLYLPQTYTPPRTLRKTLSAASPWSPWPSAPGAMAARGADCRASAPGSRRPQAAGRRVAAWAGRSAAARAARAGQRGRTTTATTFGPAIACC